MPLIVLPLEPFPKIVRFSHCSWHDTLSGASFRRGDFALREPEFGVEFWDTKIPNFGVEIFAHIFPVKRAPSKSHPQEIHRTKFTSTNSTQNSGRKIHTALRRAISLLSS